MPARFGNYFGRGLWVTALLAVSASWCHAEEPLTPTQVLSYTSIGGLRFSPDGSQLVYAAYNYRWDDTGRLRLVDAATGKMRELTPAKASESWLDWSPDGKTIAFLSTRGGRTQIYLQPAQGAGEPTALTSHKFGVSNVHWSPDGRSLSYLALDDSAK